jgi:tRNA (guanine-N7-)-methyltransferase
VCPAAPANAPPRRALYGRRQGPKLRPAAAALLGEVLLGVEFTIELGTPFDPRALFSRPPQAIRLEIGFGGGEHLAAQAAAHPAIGFLGVEPFLNGVAKLLRAVRTEDLGNVRVLRDDARLLLQVLPAASLDRVDILFPDPWPKLRHRKRRIVNGRTITELARIIRPGGELRLATDDADYARWMLAAILTEPRFAWAAERACDWREPPSDWAPTRYEAKARLAGRRPVFLGLRRVG